MRHEQVLRELDVKPAPDSRRSALPRSAAVEREKQQKE